MQRILALVKTELKKVIREPAFLFMMLLFPAALTLIFGLSFGSMEIGIPGVSQFDIMVPGLFAYACIFIIMIVAQTFTDYREQGLIKRINLTPITSAEFMISHIISNTILSIAQVVIVAVCSLLIGFRPNGNFSGFILAFIFMIMLSICSVGFGLICSTIAKNAGTATALSFIFILPQMFLGTFIPLNDTTRVIAYFLPSYYATESLSMIFLDGVAITDLSIWLNLGIIALLAILIVFIGIIIFKRYGKD
jgi:ABC-2 type transport system permease protein